MRIEIKPNTLGILILLIIVCVVGYFWFSRQNTYRLDCGKLITERDVLFVYTQTCPHCHADWVRIQELGLSDQVYMIDAGNERCREIITTYSDCIIDHKNSNYQNVPSGIFTPTKVCIHNNVTYIGEQTNDDLKSFFDNCR